MSYVAGVAWAMSAAGLEPGGADLVLDGDVPLGSGLSSSAAVEMAVAKALCALSEIPWNPLEMARLGQRVEGEFVGVKGGMMDQYTAVFGREGHALLLDCRTLEAEAVPLPDSAAIVVMDTGAPRSLAASAYNERSRSCRIAVEAHPLARARGAGAARRRRDAARARPEQDGRGRAPPGAARHRREQAAPSPWPRRCGEGILPPPAG